MDSKTIYTRLNKVFRDVFDDDSINVTPKTTAKDIEDWDSLEHITLISAVEREFKMKFGGLMKKKVLVAMSGGVDSSVAAAVLMDDYEVTGATMKLFTNEDIQLDRQKTCCSLDDVEDARYVAHKLGFEHYVYNFGDRFKECVIDRFNNAYINGETPNPCIDCNRFIIQCPFEKS